MDGYNYPSFPPQEDIDPFSTFPRLFTVGDAAPDGELTDAGDGRRVRLSELWRTAPLVVEFGSIS